MAVCRDCDQEMLAGVGCTAFPGRRRPVEGEQCHDCSAPVGGLHHPGCDMERCDHGGQAIFCDRCNDAKADTGLDYWQRMAAYDSAQAVIQADAERRYAATVAAEEARLRERFAAAIAAGLQDQARRHPGFRCDTTSNRDVFAVSGILTVSELVESAVRALQES